MSIIEVQIQMKHASNEKKNQHINQFADVLKNSMSLQRYRKKKKKNIFLTNTLNDDSIIEQNKQYEQEDQYEQEEQEEQ